MKALTRGCLVVSFLLMCGGAAFAGRYNCPPGPTSCVPAEWVDTVTNFHPTTDLTYTFDLTTIFP